MRAFNRYRSILDGATEEDWTDGRRWYDEANERITNAAYKSRRLDVRALSGAVAVLSPMTDWDRNIGAVDTIVDAVERDLPRSWFFELLSRHTAYNSNAQKALRVILDRDFGAVSGQKVEPFGANLRGDLQRVTIDRHMLHAVNNFGLKSITNNAVRSCKRAVRMCSSLYNVSPAEAQATVWIRVRRG